MEVEEEEALIVEMRRKKELKEVRGEKRCRKTKLLEVELELGKMQGKNLKKKNGGGKGGLQR